MEVSVSVRSSEVLCYDWWKYLLWMNGWMRGCLLNETSFFRRDHFFAWLAAEVQQALAISKDTSFLFEMHISICDPRLRLFFLLFFLEPRRKSMGMGIFTRLFSIFSRTPDDVFLKNASSWNILFLHYVFLNRCVGGCWLTQRQEDCFSSQAISLFFPSFFFAQTVQLLPLPQHKLICFYN